METVSLPPPGGRGHGDCGQTPVNEIINKPRLREGGGREGGRMETNKNGGRGREGSREEGEEVEMEGGRRGGRNGLEREPSSRNQVFIVKLLLGGGGM